MAVDNKKLTSMMIHSFAVAHAAAAALLANTMVGDEAVLTSLTIAMIMAVSKLNGASWDAGEALAFLGIYAGGYLGSRGAVFLLKWVPGLGSAANAAVTFGITEALGWTTYLFITKGNTNPSNMTRSEKKQAKKLWEEAKDLRSIEKEESARLYKELSGDEKQRIDDIVKQLKREDLPENRRDELISEMTGILEKYAQ